jgi:hypothetical protein
MDERVTPQGKREDKLVFAGGVFPTDIAHHLAQLAPQQSHDTGERKVVAIIAKNQHLEALPPDLPYLPSLAAHLVELDLSFNGLTHLPPALSCLDHLENLNLSHNAFAQLPPVPVMTSAATLRHLFLSGNRLSSLPPELAGLTRLENLFLGQNQFEAVPPAVFGLTSLLSLSLNHNAIRSVPADGSFARLSGLKTLDLAYNELARLALDVPSSLSSLDVSSNTLLSSLQIGCSAASSKKSAKLRHVDLSRCRLASLPESLAGFDRLASLQYADNPWNDEHAFMRTNPLPSAVLAWLRIRAPGTTGPMVIPADAITLGSEIEVGARKVTFSAFSFYSFFAGLFAFYITQTNGWSPPGGTARLFAVERSTRSRRVYGQDLLRRIQRCRCHRARVFHPPVHSTSFLLFFK